jgi:hypothetical protein
MKNDQFTGDLKARLSAFVETASIETLSAAFDKANFEGYRHLKGSFFGITDGAFDEISVSARGRVTLNVQDPILYPTALMLSYVQTFKMAADEAVADEGLALAA